MQVNRAVTTKIDPVLCTGCGLCIEVCPSETITIKDKIAVVSGSQSLNCGHCAAICPTGAVTVSGIDPAMSAFRTFRANNAWVPHGSYDTAGLVNLMRSRRSCRNFKDKPVSRDILEDLAKIGITAPSGSNCQMWTFTILPDRKSVDMLAEHIGAFFRKLNHMAGKGWLRNMMRIVGRPELHHYYHNFYESVQKGLSEWEGQGRDILFHGAAAAIIVSSAEGASCPAEDALMATQNILLGAHSMGLGTCMIGFAIAAMRKEAKINRLLGIPTHETPYAVVALGYPDEKYRRVTGRKPAVIRYFEA
jgi:nitroreductase/NAD-dependent dihydropyrimidine dehydrogenase PreA subunit